MNKELDIFIRDGIKAGKTLAELKDVLRQAGWEKHQIEKAFYYYADMPFSVAVPKPGVSTSPKMFFLNLFYFSVFYITISSLVIILFTILDTYLPDGLGRMRGAFRADHGLEDDLLDNVASLIVSAPILFLTGRVAGVLANKNSDRIPLVRLNMIYITFFIAGCAMIINLSSLVYYTLAGEISTRFLIKTAIIVGLIFGTYKYFRPEIQQRESGNV